MTESINQMLARKAKSYEIATAILLRLSRYQNKSAFLLSDSDLLIVAEVIEQLTAPDTDAEPCRSALDAAYEQYLLDSKRPD